ncbi:MAG: 2OG-Fe(II) oxygenase [Pseudomonadota bacterium]
MSTITLTKACKIARPTRDAMLQRAPSVHHFWNENETLFEEAWTEWEKNGGHGDIALDSSLYAPTLRKAIETSWENPEQEILVKDLWTEVFPNVYKAQFFDPEKLGALRDYMDRVADAEIPLRPPYGIVLNRGGAMLDPRSEGYLAAPTFQAFYQDLMNRYMRPIARLLFPEVHGYDSQTFGFSIAWQAGKDTTLRPHTDASSVTLNINLNLPGENFSGSAVRFFDQESGKVESLTFEPGTAMIHRGHVAHASEPITEGERHNFVLWLYGERGRTPYQHGQGPVSAGAQERWNTPSVKSDGFAPF